MDLKTSQIAQFNQIPQFNFSGMCPARTDGNLPHPSPTFAATPQKEKD
jgi:hypothetical protein